MKVGFGRMHRVRLEGSLGGISFLFFPKTMVILLQKVKDNFTTSTVRKLSLNGMACIATGEWGNHKTL